MKKIYKWVFIWCFSNVKFVLSSLKKTESKKGNYRRFENEAIKKRPNIKVLNKKPQRKLRVGRDLHQRCAI